MLSMIIRLYRRKQLRDLYKAWEKNAIIGDMFELGDLGANIYNESGERSRIVVGHHSRVSGELRCKSTGKIEIGNYSVVQNYVSIQCLQSVKIGHYSVLSERTVVTDNNNHRIEPEERVKHRIRVAPGGPGYGGLGDGWELSESAPVVIGDVVWVGANCLILKGVTIGEGAVVARNSVVTKNVAPYTVVAGFPAKVVKELKQPDYQYFEV